ncbi:unnamed protein product [Sordaria macrospora k-hell]|uniref:WGS project CABT00000000 data, contig 2.1 n=2 Tax=Sordaria macrospora TaxID=5147 RepID=F7VLR0_SORMK|nr:uncharacterized protein SMAC_04829 [Sordaria macrospora k-hell]KAH7627365.1 hypothetical protein B0T09DRAFT_359716 [Sordaria sp. MPI-SDFR-AT-0083]CCC06438.1 unnamed protein product [Sordaria macrospora k-hell]
MRVRRRLRRSGSDIPAQGKEMANGIQDGKLVNGEPNGGFVNTNGTAAKTRGSKSEQNGLIKRGSWGPDTTDLRRRNLGISCGWDLADTEYEKKVAVSTSLPIESTKTSTKADQSQSQSPLVLGENHGANGQRWTVDETVDLDKYEYYWEPYPDRGTAWERLDWVMDMFNSFRGAGWNYSISSIPSLQPPVIPPLPESIVTSSSSSSSSSSPSTTTSQILPYFPTGIPVSFTTLPLSTPQTFHRSPTVRHFLTTRLLHITWSYLALDFFTISARLDPYFVAGPNGPLRHPTHLSDLASLSFSNSAFPPLSLASAKFLASLPPWGLNFARSLFSLSGVLGGLFLYSYVWQLTQFFVLGRMLGNESQGMNELWRYPCFFGGFVGNVLDRGLAGFWGGWWHQSFRVGFTGPARWLVKVGRVFGDINDGNVGPDEDEDGGKTRESAVTMNGTEKSPNEGKKRRRTRKQKVVAMLEMATAFFLSGVLHALGGWTSTAFRISPSSGTDLLTLETRNRLPVFFEPVGFFVSQFLGCVIQAFLTVVLRNLLTKITGQQKTWKEMPRWLERTGNGLFVLLWLHWTRWMLIDDMARSGLFLFEPVPVSVFRLLGLGGMPGEGTKDWWRLDGEYVPSFWRGSKWWERGVRI